MEATEAKGNPVLMGGDKSKGEYYANTFLIAAAPDLYEACRAALDRIDPEFGSRQFKTTEEWIRHAMVSEHERAERLRGLLIAALAKADGRATT